MAQVPPAPLRKGLGMRGGLRKGLGMQAQRGQGLRGARACRGHSYGPRLLTASTRPARHPPPSFRGRVSSFNGTSAVSFYPAPGSFMPARLKLF